jgi:hypothetical protein
VNGMGCLRNRVDGLKNKKPDEPEVVDNQSDAVDASLIPDLLVKQADGVHRFQAYRLPHPIDYLYPEERE